MIRMSFEVERLEQGWQITGRLRTPRRTVPLTRPAVPSAIMPGVVLAQDSADWAADQLFADREALVHGAVRECNSLVDDL